jgi:hypothetical protein
MLVNPLDFAGDLTPDDPRFPDRRVETVHPATTVAHHS